MLVDNYLNKVDHVPKSDWQLIGATTMFIASKLEQFEPRNCQEFAKSTKDRYSPSQVKET